MGLLLTEEALRFPGPFDASALNPRHYQKIEEGSVNVTIETLERLCVAFGVDVSKLFEL